MKTKRRGGARPGSGRKPGVSTTPDEKKHVRKMFSLSPVVIKLLEEHVPSYQRSEFVGKLIFEELKDG